MRSLNKVMLIGNLGSDPEMRHTASGKAVTSFRLATNESWGGGEGGQVQERTEWHRIVTWGRLAEICNEYLRKGRQVYIEGRIQTREWQDQSGTKRYTTEIVAASMMMIGGRGEGGGPSGGGGGGERRPRAAAPAGDPPEDGGDVSDPGAGPEFIEDDDDLPF